MGVSTVDHTGLSSMVGFLSSLKDFMDELHSLTFGFFFSGSLIVFQISTCTTDFGGLVLQVII